MTQIVKNLYLSGVNFVKTATNIKFIINVAKECNYDTNIPFLKYDIADNFTQNIMDNMDDIVDIIKQNQNRNVDTLIHCQMGKSRSASFVIGYLMKHENMTLDKAYNFLVNKHEILPNISFMRQLMNYEKKIYGKTSFDIHYYDAHFIHKAYGGELDYIMMVYDSCGKDYDKTIDVLFNPSKK